MILFNYLFICRHIYFIINIIFTIPYIFILILNIFKNHLFLFFPNIINYPYDSFSMIIDINLVFIKILISLSRMGSKRNLSIFCFILAIIFIYMLLFYLSFIMLNKSYYLMNNIGLNKARYSLVLTVGIATTALLIIDKTKIFHIYAFISLFNCLVINLAIVFYFYDPYKYAKFGRDDNIENIFYYFFMFDRDKNKYFLIDEKIEEHISQCNMCNLCKKYNQIKNENKEIDLYKIIYNGEDIIYNLMNQIIRRIKKNGRNSFINNSYFLINIMYTYYMSINIKNNNVLLNIELLFEIINSDNKQLLEENKMALIRIKYANDFFIKANCVIEHINEILEEKRFNKNLQNFFYLGEELEKLKYNELKSNFNNNWSNRNYGSNNSDGLPNCNNLLTICSLFYEEFFNETISNSGISIRDNPNLLEDLINNNSKNIRQITLEIDILNFEVKIIRAGGQINKYENYNFFDIFINAFKNEQIFEMKKIMLNSNDLKTKNFRKKSLKLIKGIEKEKQHLNFNFLIEEKEDNEIFCKLLKLKLSLILLNHISNKIYLNGSYIINSDILVVTEQSGSEEKVLFFGSKKQFKNLMTKNYFTNKNKIYIKSIKDEKFLGYEKLVKLYDFLIGDRIYNIYHFLSAKKKSIYQIDIIAQNNRNSNINNFEEEQINLLEKINNNTFFNDITSSISSGNNSALRSNLISYTKENKKYNNNENEAKELKIVKIILIIIIIIFLSIIILLSCLLTKSYQTLVETNKFYLSFQDYSTVFHNLYFSVLSSGCIANSTISDTCQNYFIDLFPFLVDILNKHYNVSDLDEDTLVIFYLSIFIDYKKLVYYQNVYLTELLNDKINSIVKQLTKYYNDGILITLKNNVLHYKLSQNYINNTIYLSLNKENITFNDFNLLMISRFSSITNSFSNMNEPIYILNKTGEEVFNNIYIEDHLLNTYQESFYMIILDFKIFSKNLNLIINEISNDIQKAKNNFKCFLYIFLNFLLFFVIIIYMMLLLFFLIYMIIILKTLNKIYNDLKQKLNQVSIKELMKKKFDNLKLLLSFYENDINKTINNLNKIYDDYRDSYNLKIKEELKMLKREGEKEVEKDNNSNCLKQLNIIRTNKIYKYMIDRKKVFITLTLILITLAIYFANLILWILLFKKDKKIEEWKLINERVLSITNILMNNYLLMIYDNKTIEEISLDYDSDDFISFIFTEITPLYSLSKFNDYLSNMINTSITKSIFCQEFYESINSELYIALMKKFHDEIDKFNYTMYFYCEWYHHFLLNNYYLQLFSIVRKGMESFKNFYYSDIIEHINKIDVIKIDLMYITLYIHILDRTLQTIKHIFLSMMDEFGKKIIITNIIVYPLLFALIFIAFFLYIRNINNDCKKFIYIRKIFKVCNTN